MELENRLYESVKNKIKPEEKAALLGAFLFSILAHGYGMANKISYHDDPVCLFSFGATLTSGRWFTGLITYAMLRVSGIYSLPLFNAVLALIFIAVAAVFVIRICRITSKAAAFLAGGIMVVFPVVTSTFNYTFMDWVYTLALLMSVLSVYLLRETVSVGRIAISALLLACSLGIYQAFLAVAVTLFFMVMIYKCIDNAYESIAKAVINGVIYAADLVLGLALWVIIRNLLLKLVHQELSDYQGMNESYQLTLLPKRITEAYVNFFGGTHCGIFVYPSAGVLFVILAILSLILCISLLAKRGKALLTVLALLLLCMLPMTMNLVYLLSTSSEYLVHTMMLYAQVFVYIFPIGLLERCGDKLFYQSASVMTVAAVSLSTLLYAYWDGAAYVKAEILQKQTIAYYTELVANIKAADGFSGDMPIVFVGGGTISDATICEMNDFADIAMVGYDYTYGELINDYAYLSFMREHIGFGNANVHADDGTMASTAAVSAMPCYPDDGSIAVVDDVLVVKLGDGEEE